MQRITRLLFAEAPVPLVESSENLSADEAEERGLPNLIKAAALNGQTFVIHSSESSEPAVVMIGVGRVQALEETQHDVHDLFVTLTRMATDAGERTSLDDAIAMLRFTPEELAEFDDDD